MGGIFFRFVILLLCLAFSKEVLSKRRGHTGNVNGGRIVGGYNTTIQNIPYQVYLLLQKGTDYYQCGGSIISNRYILTAAHCLSGIQSAYIRAGSTNSNSGGRMYVASSFRQHPSYNSRTSDYDFGYVRTMTPITIDGKRTRVVTLAQSNKRVEPGTELLISGWGATSENGPTASTLMAVRIPSVSTEDCQESYSTITPRMFCAGVPEGGKDSCQGDSGGPVVNDDTGIQMGVVSFGIGCARPGYPGVYANISSVRDWIRRNTGV